MDEQGSNRLEHCMWKQPSRGRKEQHGQTQEGTWHDQTAQCGRNVGHEGCVHDELGQVSRGPGAEALSKSICKAVTSRGRDHNGI